MLTTNTCHRNLIKNMKYIYFCFLITICYGIVINKSSGLNYPHRIHIKINDEPQSFDISWRKVDRVDNEDPVLGYKVKVIEVNKVKRYKNKVNNETGAATRFEVEEYPKINIHNTPDGKVTLLTAPASDTPVVTFDRFELEVPYEITVYAYTKKTEGPSSAPIRFRVRDD